MIFESSEMYENITISLPLESNIKKYYVCENY